MNCHKCNLPLSDDHTHRTYEEHDACRNAPSPDKWDALNVKRVDAGWIHFEGEQHTRYVLEEDYDRLLSELRGMERGGEGPTHDEVLSALATFENSSKRNGQEDGMRQALEWFVAFRKRNVAPVATLSVTEGVDGTDGNQKGRQK